MASLIFEQRGFPAAHPHAEGAIPEQVLGTLMFPSGTVHNQDFRQSSPTHFAQPQKIGPVQPDKIACGNVGAEVDAGDFRLIAAGRDFDFGDGNALRCQAVRWPPVPHI